MMARLLPTLNPIMTGELTPSAAKPGVATARDVFDAHRCGSMMVLN
jgi:hypothetical protein